MTNFNFQLQHIPQTVVVFGCGGTGSRIVPALAQLMSTTQTLINPELVLVDFDEVEEKNLSRQNFAKPDVGRNKAEALAGRYSKAFGIKITPITVAAGTPSYNEAVTMFGLAARLSSPALYIIAVDSVVARQAILSYAFGMQHSAQHSSVIIDCGNEDVFGQVSYFTTGGISPEAGRDLEFMNNWYQGVIPGDLTLNELPIDAMYYARMQEGESTKSCADLDQTLAINNLMAAQAIAISQNILMGKTMRYWRVNFDLFNGVSYDTISVPEIVKRAGSLYDTMVGAKTEFERKFVEDVKANFLCQANTSKLFLDLCEGLEEEALSESPVRYQASQQIRAALGLPKFIPSTVFAPTYPDFYTEEYISLWSEGYKLPALKEEDLKTYELVKSILEEMQAECDKRNAEEAQAHR